mmetsp:Transcript_99156/g.201161  ORF Transcript_99156/g.201161 Transcript_99156/m.201161 type:complete len:86 (-) Transcript_99156:1222-1479(-)
MIEEVLPIYTKNSLHASLFYHSGLCFPLPFAWLLQLQKIPLFQIHQVLLPRCMWLMMTNLLNSDPLVFFSVVHCHDYRELTHHRN